MVQLHGEPSPEEKERPIRDQDGKQIEMLYLGIVSLAGGHMDERKKSERNNYGCEANAQRTVT